MAVLNIDPRQRLRTLCRSIMSAVRPFIRPSDVWILLTRYCCTRM